MELISNKDKWTEKKRIAIRLGRIVLGYLAAVLVSTTIVLLPFGILSNWGSSIWFVGLFITATAAFFPTMLFVWYNEIYGRFGPYGHMISGAAVALVAHILFQLFEASVLARQMNLALISLSMIGGAAGALAYWKIAVAYLQNNPFRIDISKAKSVF